MTFNAIFVEPLILQCQRVTAPLPLNVLVHRIAPHRLLEFSIHAWIFFKKKGSFIGRSFRWLQCQMSLRICVFMSIQQHTDVARCMCTKLQSSDSIACLMVCKCTHTCVFVRWKERFDNNSTDKTLDETTFFHENALKLLTTSQGGFWHILCIINAWIQRRSQNAVSH